MLAVRPKTPDSIAVSLFGAASPAGCSPGFNVVGSALGVVNNATIGVETVVPSPWGDEYRFEKPACDPTIPIEVRYIIMGGGWKREKKTRVSVI